MNPVFSNIDALKDFQYKYAKSILDIIIINCKSLKKVETGLYESEDIDDDDTAFIEFHGEKENRLLVRLSYNYDGFQISLENNEEDNLSGFIFNITEKDHFEKLIPEGIKNILMETYNNHAGFVYDVKELNL